MIPRNKIVSLAETWEGTPFHHQGRLKNVGVDCLGLIVGVGDELGLNFSRYDETNYGRVPYDDRLFTAFYRLPKTTVLLPGNIALFFVYGKLYPSHCGWVVDTRGEPGMIHAFGKVRTVVKTRLGRFWLPRLHSVYDITGLE